MLAYAVVEIFGHRGRIDVENIASGEVVASFALTEHVGGPNPAGLKTTAKSDGNGWIINGTKQYIINATEAGLFPVFARTATASEKSTGIGVFLVPAGASGIAVGNQDAKMGRRAPAPPMSRSATSVWDPKRW